jgi:membrane associated rhomboid family serine protease
MIPLRDVIPSRTTPIVTYLIIAVNLAAFVYELAVMRLPEPALERFYLTYGLIPAHFSWTAAVTSMFLHDGWLHIAGNLWSLWIFGDNVEDRLGHGRFLFFYLACGVMAGLVQTWVSPDSPLPVVGASGAIAGVMGAYFVLFPYSRVLVLIFLFVFVDVIELPAVFFLGFWFFMQLIGGVGRLAETALTGGVAFWAHVGGFLTGVAGVWLLRRPERQRVDWWT